MNFEVNINMKNCRHMISTECLRLADKSQFVGNFCSVCHQVYRAGYYIHNRERLLRRANERYVPNGRPRGRPRRVIVNDQLPGNNPLPENTQ